MKTASLQETIQQLNDELDNLAAWFCSPRENQVLCSKQAMLQNTTPQCVMHQMRGPHGEFVRSAHPQEMHTHTFNPSKTLLHQSLV